MAEVILGSVADSVAGHLLSPAFQEIGRACGVKGELTKLGSTVEAIKAVLAEAENGQVESGIVKNWLKKLSDAVYETDDLLDDFSTEALRRRLMGGNRIMKEVRIFFSSSNRLFYSFKMAHQLKAIRETLDAIYDDRSKYNLNPDNIGNPAPAGRNHDLLKKKRMQLDSIPLLHESIVIGRDEDKKEICRFLFDSMTDENVSVLPIVGIGGLGKTTLAKHVFNDEGVQAFFELKVWVCVSDNFDVEIIVKKILPKCDDPPKKPKDSSMEEPPEKPYGNKIVQPCDGRSSMEELPEKIDGKKFLLVLDDVWNENRHEWLKLRGFFKKGAKGSKILVTTRGENVAKTMSNRFHLLKGLPEDKSLSLLMQMASKKEHEWKDQSLETIGRKIARKCRGVPLALTTMGRLLLFTRDTEEDWLEFSNRDLVEIKQEETDILPTLKLSYDPLPSHLKRCFSYCSLFPKDWEFNPDELIHLWMAQGFFKSSHRTNRTPEDVGGDCFMELVRRCFFQDLEEDMYGNIYRCKMHDLMHDLAKMVAGNNFAVVDSFNIGGFRREEALHVSTHYVEDVGWIEEAHNKVRSLLCFHEFGSGINPSIKVTPTFRSVRVLRLQYNNSAKAVPKSIGKLKHLRSLHLSGYNLKSLPSSISKLHNLEMLKLRGRLEITELPRGITKLVNLRQLDVSGCELTHMPKGIEKLTNLQILSDFVVGEKGNPNAARLDGLSKLGGLKKNLTIKHLERVENASQQSFAVKSLKLQSLELWWQLMEKKPNEILEQVRTNQEASLERLQPHSDLKGLVISEYSGRTFHPWISQLHQLVRLKIIGCIYCRRLPPIHQLPLLKSLDLSYLSELEYIEVEGGNRSSTFFPSLEEVQIIYLPNFKGWQCLQGNSSEVNDIDDKDENSMLLIFPKKIEVGIYGCPKFSYLGHGENLVLINVNEKHIRKLVRNSEVQTPPNKEVTMVSPLISLSSMPTTELKFLHIEGMSSVEVLPEELFHSLTSLQRLEIVNGQHLKSLPWRTILNYLPGLEHLEIMDCPELDLSSVFEEEADLQWQYGHMDSKITKVSICGVRRMSGLPWWFQHLSGLEVLRIEDCDGLEALSEINYCHTSLRELTLSRCKALKSLSRRMILLLITTLKKWWIYDCEELDLNGELDGDCDDMANSQLLKQTTLSELIIRRSRAEILPWWIEHLNNLEVLHIKEWENLKALPEWFSKLTSLRELTIRRCKELKSLPRRTIIHLITTLEKWKIRSCEELDLNGELDGDSDNEANSQHSTLHELIIIKSRAKLLPWWIKHLNNLEVLNIEEWENLKALPKWFSDLTSLKMLRIWKCPLITKRCKENGADWPKISHIAEIYIDGVGIGPKVLNSILRIQSLMRHVETDPLFQG